MNYKHYRRTLKDSDEKKNLEKMSRPRITFPGLPKVTTRPDQEVQPIETARQKELFGRKAVADIKDQTAPVYNLGSKTGERLVSRKEERAKQAKKIAGKFNRQTVGLNVDTKHGPKSAAITGKLRSKYEEGDEDYATKMAEHKQKRAEAIKAHNQLVDEWNAKAQKIRGKLQQASTPQDREAIMYEYYEHRKTAPKFKAPRAPSKKAKITTALSPEQAALRGKATSATIEHEGFHHIFDDIGHKYGPVAAANARKKILEQHNLEALAEVGAFISDRLGYDRKSSHFTEEVLAHSRDILVNPTKREAFKKFVGTEKADQHIKNLKQGHQKAYEAAKKLTLADIMPVGAPVQEPKKMAASEGLNKNEEDPGLFYQKRFASWKFKTPQEAEEKIRRDVEHGNKQFSELFGRVDYEKDVAPHIHFPQYKSYYVISSKKTKTRNPRQRPEFNTSDELADKQINNHFNLYADPTVRYSKIKEEHVNNILPLETFDEERVQKLVSHIKAGGELPPILLDEGAVADGHHRLEAAKRLKIKKVPVVHILRQEEEPSSFNKNELAKAPIENYDSSIGREVPEHPMKERYEHSAKSTEVAPGIYHHALFSNRNQEALHMLSNHPDPFYPKATIYSQLLGDAERPAGPITVQLSQVHPEHKGKGHGKALYEFALKHHGTIHSDELVSPQAEDVYWHLKGKGAEVKFGKPDTRERHEAKYMPSFTPSFRKLAANEKTSYSKEMEKVQTLEHYSPKSGLQAIDPSYQRTGADVRARHHQTEHPHSFYYRKGTTLPPEDVHVHGAASSKYEIDIPDDAKLYDLSSDPEGHISSLRQESMSSPINPGVVSMDDIHGRLKSLGYHGFYASEHPALSNVVGLYHSMPVSREEKLR